MGLTTLDLDKIIAATKSQNLNWQWGGRIGSLSTKQIHIKTISLPKFHVGTIRIGTGEWFSDDGWRREQMLNLLAELEKNGVKLTEASRKNK